MDKIHNGVLRKFHTLCSRLGLTEAEKRAIVESFGVESSADIDTHALIDVCASLSKQLEGDTKATKWINCVSVLWLRSAATCVKSTRKATPK